MNIKYQKLIYFSCGLVTPWILLLLGFYLPSINFLVLGLALGGGILSNWLALVLPALLVFIISFYLINLKTKETSNKAGIIKSLFYFILGTVIFVVSFFMVFAAMWGGAASL